jgi:glutamate synthase domain-containing protein 3
MNGARIVVYGNCQDGVANTMNSGEIIVYGSLGDVAGYGMRGGRLFVKGDVGYRVGIHMKEYKKQVPVIIAGGTAGDFFGEYMAGGIMILLGLDNKQNIVGDYVGTGMHGGVIFIRGEVETHQLGKEVAVLEPSQEDLKLLTELLKEYCGYFGLNLEEVMSKKFIKPVPLSCRPYGNLCIPSFMLVS